MSEEQTSEHNEEVTSALVVYKNLQITTSELIQEMTASHLDKVNLGKVLQALLSDLSYEPNRFNNVKAQRLYQLGSALLKAKEVLRADMKNKLAANEVGNISEETKNKLIKEL
jgi:hypothetical protein